MKLETWVLLVIVIVVGALLLYPIRSMLRWDAIETAALLAASLLIISVAVVGLYVGVRRLASWIWRR